SGNNFESVSIVFVVMMWIWAISKNVSLGDCLVKTVPRSASSSTSSGTYPSKWAAAWEGDCKVTFLLKLSDNRSWRKESSLCTCSPLGNSMRTGGNPSSKEGGVT